jgi:hypothetical protein
MAIEKKWWMLGLAGVIGLSIGIYRNHPPDYCYEEKRIVPDEQFLEWALLSLKPQMKLDGSEVSIQTYLAKHPGCCQIFRGGTNLVPKDQIYGLFAFEFNDEEFSRGGDRYYVKDIVWDACGRVVEHTGSSSNIPPPGFKDNTQGK